jgi:hypothetical protein
MDVTQDDQRELENALLRLNGRAWGISIGLVLGFGLFIATNLLVVKGGVDPGRHLRLIGVFFPGYSVSFIGSIIGFVYAFVVGYGLGRMIGSVYNRLSSRGTA